ncbi:hypothetical protein TanjilG_33053 [Lupinus angustifolius]|uniref:Uncharacterized protein n=1 Tax=Lupinus angustifolius TaxID=3871 RepID=A0A4P1RP38_LUPAN|nr:PREDICTED: protein MCM10 homolog isoform X1 [Lupinus angustifolius]OIW14711.1 hypothetical protein TanjilG_33053 [Lupinus angustifolius]
MSSASSSSQQYSEDLDLLLSLQDSVPESPPLEHSIDVAPNPRIPLKPKSKPKPKPRPLTDDADLDTFSGLRIRDRLLTSMELRDSFSDIRFVRLSVIKNLLNGDSFSGSWVTVGVLTEKGSIRKTSTGKEYCIYKITCLDENTVSLFLFAHAYQSHTQHKPGTVFALFNSNVRRDTNGDGYSLSIYSPGQILKMGMSVDYGVCKGRRPDGMACTLAINKRNGTYCKYHKNKASDKYSTMRTELKGGNLRTAFRPRDYLKSEGIHLVDPLANKTNMKKSQSLKLMSVDGLRRALSNAGKVTTNMHSQGIRFLTEVTGKLGQAPVSRGPKIPNEQSNCTGKRKSSSVNVGSSEMMKNQHLDAKRVKTDGQVLVDKTTSTGKMIELDFVSSDEDF